MNCTQMLSILRRGILSHRGAQPSLAFHFSLLAGPLPLGSVPAHFILWAQSELPTILMMHFRSPDYFTI